MVSSDFGKLDVRRHLISGDDWAIAGEATAAAAAPVAADTFKKSRRFIQTLLSGRFPEFTGAYSTARQVRCNRRCSGGARSNTDVCLRKRRRVDRGAK